jgi:hypothetical protein
MVIYEEKLKKDKRLELNIEAENYRSTYLNIKKYRKKIPDGYSLFNGSQVHARTIKQISPVRYHDRIIA